MSGVVRILPSGHEFVVQSDEPLLEAALRSGLALEFGCTNGSCGECKGRVKEGEVRRIRFHDYVIRDAEKRDGAVLLCCCTADGDVTIEAGEAGGPDDIPLQHVRARLYSQEVVAGKVAIVRLRVMRGQMLRFLGGQHVRLKSVTGQGVNQAADISIASCPCDGLNLEFHFDSSNGDEMSARAIAGFTKSDRFEIEGPRGRFVLDESSERPLVFLACETGIAPAKSIIEHVINLERAQPMVLYWHAGAANGHYLQNYFRSLADALDEFRYLPIEERMSPDTFEKMPDAAGVDAYLAGNEAFVSDAGDLLLDLGAPRERIFVDALNRRPVSAPREG
jgi:CDP-4-dehydro-6-deoxyglucose reductase